MDAAAASRCELELPGFRFHPTEDELLQFYLSRTLAGNDFCDNVIGFLNIYNYDPWELPELAKIGEREWYFFVARDKKHGTGGRPNRTTQHGFWKATGSDRQIMNTTSYPKTLLGLKKTLVYYEGRAPRGKKTDWIMNEYRLPHKSSHVKDIVLCKIYRKATSLKVLEHRAAAMEEETCKNASQTWDSISFCSDQSEEANLSCSHTDTMNANTWEGIGNKEVERQQGLKGEESAGTRSCSSLVLPSNGSLSFAELQVPSLDWTQDSFWTLFSPPCIDNFASFLPMC